MLSIVQWLEGLGLGQYGAAFVEAEIDLAVLPDLREQDLEELGVKLGHRKKLLRAIAALSAPTTTTKPAPTAATSMSAEAERRQVTVMFCDLVGSTELSARLDPEDLRAVIGAYHRCCAEVILTAQGFVAKYMGDGVLAYFGYPQAHENDAEQAVRAGLALVEAVRGINAAAKLQVRIGIATGLVVVGDLIGEGAAQEQAMVGETPNLAARLQALAEPGTVVIAATTRRLLGGLFEYSDLGPVPLKGFAEPLPTWQVLRTGALETRFEARQEGGVTPLVGREEELDLLLRRWRQVQAGAGRVVLLTGEPGIGKSRLGTALLERLEGEPHTRLRYFCSPHHQDSALYPAIAQLERAAGFTREDAPEAKRGKLERLLAQSNATDEEIALIADLLSLLLGGDYSLPEFSPQRRKEKTLGALLTQTQRVAAQRPVLAIYEDVHWIDPTSLELLTLAVEQVARLPVLLLITARPEFTPPWPGHAHVTTMPLTRLDQREGAALVARVTRGKKLPDEVLEQILARTDGVPLFMEELTKTVLESGLLREEREQYVLTGPLPPFAIPTTLHDSLMARLDRLAAVRNVVQTSAALGREFSYELLQAVAEVPDAQLHEALSQLVRSELVFCRGVPPQAVYIFKHALVQDAAYGSLLRSRRQQLHARIATTLERRFPEIVATQPERLAQHCTEAGLVEQAIGYWLKAGQQAVARSAMTEALALLRSGLALVSSVPDSAARQQNELDLQIAWGRALYAVRGFAAPEADQAYARARQLCEQLNRPAQLVPVLVGQFEIRLARAEHEQVRQDAEEISRLGEESNDALLQHLGYFFCGLACYGLGEFSAARVYLERSEVLTEDGSVYSALPAVHTKEWMSLWLSSISCCLGYFDQARMRLDELQPASPVARTIALMAAWQFGWCVHSAPGSMLERADELSALAVEQGLASWRAVGAMYRGWCLAALGQAEDGVALLTSGLADYRATGTVFYGPMVLTLLGDAYGMAEQPHVGLQRLAEALQLCGATRERWVEAEVHRNRGELLILTGDRVAAEASFLEALALARQQSAKLWELRAATSLAGLWRDQNKLTEARDLLAPVYGWFTEGVDTPILQDAKALLDELAAN